MSRERDFCRFATKNPLPFLTTEFFTQSIETRSVVSPLGYYE